MKNNEMNNFGLGGFYKTKKCISIIILKWWIIINHYCVLRSTLVQNVKQ